MADDASMADGEGLMAMVDCSLTMDHFSHQPSAISHAAQQPRSGYCPVSPTFSRAKGVPAIGEPSALLAASITCFTDIFGSRIDSWSGRTPPGICLKKAPSLPSMIFSITLAGLPEFSI